MVHGCTSSQISKIWLFARGGISTKRKIEFDFKVFKGENLKVDGLAVRIVNQNTKLQTKKALSVTKPYRNFNVRDRRYP
jgi:hypothetical protein